jgi:glycosyltransferase involved in cell wall biosynthesis
MANQTLQLAKLLREEGATVELVQVNLPYRPHWIGSFIGIRAAFRLVPYLARLWQSANKANLFHVMANSGWSWHLFAAPAVWLARVKSKPVIIHYHGGEAGKFFNESFRWVKPSLNRASAIIVPSSFLGAVFKKRGFSAGIVPNVIDLSRFHPVIPQTSSKAHFPHVIVTRNLEPVYDIRTALHAFKIVRRTFPGARLTVAGSGPERQSLEELACRLGVADATTFTGRLDNGALPVLYKSADVMLNPSLADNMPVSVLEALASGVPVVTTDVGGIPCLVEHEKTALLVPPQNPEAMAEAVLILLNDPGKANQIINAGLEAVRQYTWPDVRERLFRIYAQVLAEPDRVMAEQK